jgi:uncharacterized protein YigA (DUF484 family)
MSGTRHRNRLQIAQARIDALQRQLTTARSTLLTLQAVDDAERRSAEDNGQSLRLIYRPKCGP